MKTIMKTPVECIQSNYIETPEEVDVKFKQWVPRTPGEIKFKSKISELERRYSFQLEQRNRRRNRKSRSLRI